MIETLLITWRETLEAALIVGILLTYLARSGQAAGRRHVWLGAGAAVLASIVCGAASGGAVTLLEPDTQELIQAGILFLAVGVVSWMVLWMNRHGRAMRGELERKADRALETGRHLGLAAVAFVAVFREGVET
ncbi:MAG TPA: FTR1 family protein, partial [Candidatus Binatus sp.]|nr:FTR1 family protein [Candidatus Binatus sp.]